MNTLGQDRCFSDDQKLSALRCIQEYRDRWEALEKENLCSDVNAKIERAEFNAHYKEHLEPMDISELDK